MDGKEDRIRQLAHEFWLQEGKPEGRAKEHWERARRQIEADQPETDGTPRSDHIQEQAPGSESPSPSKKEPVRQRSVKAAPATPKTKSTSRTKTRPSTSSSADEST